MRTIAEFVPSLFSIFKFLFVPLVAMPAVAWLPHANHSKGLSVNVVVAADKPRNVHWLLAALPTVMLDAVLVESCEMSKKRALPIDDALSFSKFVKLVRSIVRLPLAAIVYKPGAYTVVILLPAVNVEAKDWFTPLLIGDCMLLFAAVPNARPRVPNDTVMLTLFIARSALRKCGIESTSTTS